jgi:hypothetical protein
MAVEETVGPALRRLQADGTRVVYVRLEQKEDSSGRAALFVVLVLADPPPGRQTWPVDDVIRLKRMVLDEFVEKEPDFDLPWFVEIESEHPDELDPEDAREQIDVDAA